MAHEWGHFFDNMVGHGLSEGDTGAMATCDSLRIDGKTPMHAIFQKWNQSARAYRQRVGDYVSKEMGGSCVNYG